MLAEGRPAGDGDGIVLLQAADPVTRSPSSAGSGSRSAPACWPVCWPGSCWPAGSAGRCARWPPRPAGCPPATAARGRRPTRRPRSPTCRGALNDLAGALATSENRQRAFLMSVSHELRTPLTTIKGYAEALADGVVGADGAQRAGQTMLAESEHLDRLVEDLLVLARLEADDFPLEVMPVELVALVDQRGRVVGRPGRRGRRVAAHRAAGRTGLRAHRPGPGPPGGRRAAGERAAGRAAGRAGGAGRPGRRRARVRHGHRPRRRPTLALPVAGAMPPPAPAASDWRDAADCGGRTRWSRCATAGPGFTDDDLAVVFERGALYERYKGSPQGRQRAGPGAGRPAGRPARRHDRGRPRARGRRPLHRPAAAVARLGGWSRALVPAGPARRHQVYRTRTSS